MEYKKEISIIIPAYNEKGRIKKTLFSIEKYFYNKNFEIIVVNDGSSDDTLGLLNNLKKELQNFKIISYQKNRGKGYAVKKGIEEAQGKYILFLDADNSTPIEEYDKLLPTLKNGYDISIGSRYLPGSKVMIKQNFLRIIIGRIGNKIIQLLLIKGIRDTQCGFKLFKNRVAKKIFSKQTIERWGFDIEILAIAQIMKYKIKEVPITWLNAEDSRFQAIRDAWLTLNELVKIKINIIKKKYSDDF